MTEETTHNEEHRDGEKKTKKSKYDKKMQNMISAIILLAGLFVGSLFVDTAQFMKGNGFSVKNLSKSDIFEANGKTWVAYSEPAVVVQVINDDSCDKCDVSEALVWLRRVLPTVSTEKVAFDSANGKQLIDKYQIRTLPAFIFDSDIVKTDFYSQAQVLFDPKDTSYILKTQELGLPAGKYLALPQINEGDVISGPVDAKVKVIIYSDFQCPYCKLLFTSLRTLMVQYKDNVLFDYKHLPLDFHPQAAPAALAAECAQEQGKFWEYGDKLYATQAEWTNTKDTAKFKDYARVIGLNATNFNKCLDDKKYQNKIDADKAEATSFGISGTPALFINDDFETGAISTDQLKAAIEAQLNPGSESTSQQPSDQTQSPAPVGQGQ
jgi:protein-disulfide isomerase